ncbi:MAG: superoxide dismutase [Sphingomonadaceae bacterium]|nr:superoxide dismutase [Sphingomonadaceae bacterium]
MPFELPDLPYPRDAFGETISAETFDFHHGKHHKSYVDKTNDALADAGLEGRKLSEVIKAARDKGDDALFNNAAQVWNHSFFWQCLSPEKQAPSGKLAALIEEGFGSTTELIAKVQEEGEGHFASGWAWLVLEGGAIKVTSLHDADTPVVHEGIRPLLTIDVWEHAYYLDYRNERPDYLEAVLGKALNWEFAAKNLDGEGVSRADQEG